MPYTFGAYYLFLLIASQLADLPLQSTSAAPLLIYLTTYLTSYIFAYGLAARLRKPELAYVITPICFVVTSNLTGKSTRHKQRMIMVVVVVVVVFCLNCICWFWLVAWLYAGFVVPHNSMPPGLAEVSYIIYTRWAYIGVVTSQLSEDDENLEYLGFKDKHVNPLVGKPYEEQKWWCLLILLGFLVFWAFMTYCALCPSQSKMTWMGMEAEENGVEEEEDDEDEKDSLLPNGSSSTAEEEEVVMVMVEEGQRMSNGGVRTSTTDDNHIETATAPLDTTLATSSMRSATPDGASSNRQLSSLVLHREGSGACSAYEIIMPLTIAHHDYYF